VKVFGLRRLGLISALIGLLVGSLNVPTAEAAHEPNPFRTGRTLVIPHAGGDGLYPENTMLAWERSLALGAEVVDIDVRLAADGVPVAIHDATVDRTTNATGWVKDLTSTQLATLDAGYRFSRQGKRPFRGRGLTVPRLDTVLRRFPGRLYTLDLKDQRVDLVQPLCTLIARMKLESSLYVGIDVDVQVEEFRKRCPSVRTSGTGEDRQLARAARESGDRSFVSHQLVSQPRYLNDDGTPRVTAESLAWSHSHGTAVLTYVVDNPTDMDRLLQLGVDGIYTRRPDVLLARRRVFEQSRKG
jgi:glycerophosphoryl diester phosphodiesterase